MTQAQASRVTQLLDNAYVELQYFDLDETYRCINTPFIQYKTTFVPGSLATVYIKSNNAKHIDGAIILSDAFSGARGHITATDLAWIQQRHKNITINNLL